MPTFSGSQIPPPSNWQDFEDLCCDLWREIWGDPNAHKNGRQGQPQSGVDIYGRPNQGDLWAGVQCKGKDNFSDQLLTDQEIKTEVEKAKSFEPKLSEFIIATTAPKDAGIERFARNVTKVHLRNDLFPIHVWFWKDIVSRLADFPQIIRKHYSWLSMDNQRQSDRLQALERSQALRFGYGIAWLEYLLLMTRKGVELENSHKIVENSVERCRVIANSIGIELPENPDELLEQAGLKIESKLNSTQKLFLIGKVMGIAYFTCINHVAALVFLGREIEEERIEISMDALERIEAEDWLTQAALPPDFLDPVKQLWDIAIQSARRGQGDPHKLEREMQTVIEQLCMTIENIQ